MATFLMAQAPQKFSYQAVVRDAAGNLVSNAPVGVRVSILKSSADGVAVYCETHLSNTNATGLLLLEIGGGTVVGGDFASIDWANGPYFLKTETDVTGGTNYTMTSSQQLLSVPYALYAGNAIEMEERISNLEKQLDSLKLHGRSAFNLLEVETSEVTSITSNSAECGGYVLWLDDGLPHMKSRGVCWSTSQHPTITDNKTSDGAELGSFSSSITGLTANTIYYVRAYATNDKGTVYGKQKQFTTQKDPTESDGKPCPGEATVTDHEGNVYNTVQIGKQCWTKENLRTTTSPTTGTYLVNNDTVSSKISSYTGKQAYWYMNDSLTYAPLNYGLLYNWNAAVDTFNVNYSNDELSINHDLENTYSVTFTGNRRGICPEGWHLPTDAEWLQLTDYVISIEEYRSKGCECNPEDKKYVNCIVKALASTTGWKRLADTEQNKEYEEKYGDFLPGKNPADNNATGFTAFPAGYYSGSYGMFADLDNFSLVGGTACFQSATSQDMFFSGAHLLDYDMISVSHSGLTKDHACSVRCLRD